MESGATFSRLLAFAVVFTCQASCGSSHGKARGLAAHGSTTDVDEGGGGIGVSGLPGGADGPLSDGIDGLGGTIPGDPNGTTGDPNGTSAGGGVVTHCSTTTPNAVNVGAPCSRGKRGCVNGEAIFCTADLTSAQAGFCTLPCGSDGDCGAGATCLVDAGNPKIASCVPNSCIAPGTTIPPVPPVGSCSPTGTASGVSKPCTARGRQCVGLKANMCTADFPGAPTAGMCTVPNCASDSACGAGARCIEAAAFSLCVANACLPAG